MIVVTNYVKLLKKYWTIPVLIIIITIYVYGKFDLQNTLRKNGKFTIGTRVSTIKFKSGDHSGTIIYYVKNKMYSINSPKSIAVGSQVNLVYDSLNPNRATVVDTSVLKNIKNLKIDF